jgi:hypothetical protein
LLGVNIQEILDMVRLVQCVYIQKVLFQIWTG